jgi:serine protease Do
MPLIERMIVSGDTPPRPRIGVTLWVLNETNGPLNGLPSWGLYIEAIAEDSDLRNYSVQVGDVLMEADGIALLNLADLDRVLQKHKAGEEISLLVYRSEMGTTLLVYPKLLEGIE